jgi:hypothetical protein
MNPTRSGNIVRASKPALITAHHLVPDGRSIHQSGFNRPAGESGKKQREKATNQNANHALKLSQGGTKAKRVLHANSLAFCGRNRPAHSHFAMRFSRNCPSFTPQILPIVFGMAFATTFPNGHACRLQFNPLEQSVRLINPTTCYKNSPE